MRGGAIVIPELFEAPFNLAGESQSSELTAEGEARVKALAESEARKAQAWLILKAPVPGKAIMERMYPLHDDTNENAL
jgi:hypothetical protein